MKRLLEVKRVWGVPGSVECDELHKRSLERFALIEIELQSVSGRLTEQMRIQNRVERRDG